MNAMLSGRRSILLSAVYGAIVLASAGFGVLLSTGAQSGGIGKLNAFLAPFLGPWSPILRPNASAVTAWTGQYLFLTICQTLVLPASVAGSYLAVRRWLRRTVTGVAVLALLAWVLAGLSKVVLELM